MSGLGCKLLKKMGWTEGNGIGKTSTGITEPIKPRLKIGTAGVGFRESERLCSGWWMDAFNKAAATADGAAKDGGDAVSKKQPSPTAAAPALLGRPYSAFAAAAAVLRDGREETAATTTATTVKPQPPQALPPTPSDADLLAACGGRTAHPAARFGLGLGGKLARVRAHDLRACGGAAAAAADAAVPAAAVEADDEAAANSERRRQRRRERRKRRQLDAESAASSEAVAAASSTKVART